jgi:hypothetical protein
MTPEGYCESLLSQDGGQRGAPTTSADDTNQLCHDSLMTRSTDLTVTRFIPLSDESDIEDVLGRLFRLFLVFFFFGQPRQRDHSLALLDIDKTHSLCVASYYPDVSHAQANDFTIIGHKH